MRKIKDDHECYVELKYMRNRLNFPNFGYFAQAVQNHTHSQIIEWIDWALDIYLNDRKILRIYANTLKEVLKYLEPYVLVAIYEHDNPSIDFDRLNSNWEKFLDEDRVYTVFDANTGILYIHDVKE